MDLSLECVYPIPEATATGISVISSQVIGILMVVIFPKMGRPLDASEMSTETCSTDTQSDIAILDYTSKRRIEFISRQSPARFSSTVFHGGDHGGGDTVLFRLFPM